jgi:hypothetical protein
MVFTILDTVYSVDVPVVGIKKPDTAVSASSVRLAAEYCARIRGCLSEDFAAESGFDAEEDGEDEVAVKRQRASNRLLLLPSLADTSADPATSAAEVGLDLALELFEAKFQSALLNGFSRELLESKILPNIIRFFPPATKAPAAAGAAADVSVEVKKASSFYPADAVKKAFIKMVRFKGSPPNTLPATVAPLSKVNLLVFLHQ